MKLKATVKFALLASAIFQVNNQAFAAEDFFGISMPSSLSPISTNTEVASVPAGGVVALNRDVVANGKLIAKGSELIADETGNLSLVKKNGAVVDTGLNVDDLAPGDYTILQQNEVTGELEPYNIPDDFDLAGPGGGRRRRSGVTNCYHVVKALVRRRITLTGVAAYMAAPQLRAAGWHRYASYGAAPMGSVCVFAAGGIRTRSGGQIYGHVGVKGAGGIANPMSGFHLKRPFLGCWNER